MGNLFCKRQESSVIRDWSNYNQCFFCKRYARINHSLYVNDKNLAEPNIQVGVCQQCYLEKSLYI